jgi:hypothetical protein
MIQAASPRTGPAAGRHTLRWINSKKEGKTVLFESDTG